MKKKNITTSVLLDHVNADSAFMDTVLSIIPEAVILIKDRKIAFVSPKAMEIFGIKDQKHIIGSSTRILYFSDEDFEYFGKLHYEQMKKDGVATGIVIIKRPSDGTPLQLAVHSKFMDENQTRVVTVFKKDLYSVLQPETFYRASPVDFEVKISEFNQILNSLNMAVLTIDANGTVDYTNNMMNDILADHPPGTGTKCFELCEHVWSETNDNFCSWCGIKKVIATGKPYETIIKTDQGKQWLFSWAPIWGDGKTVSKVVKTVTDITAQMAQKSYIENILFDIFAAIPTGVVMLNDVGKIIFINASMEKRWGLSYSQVAMTKLAELEIYTDNDMFEQDLANIKKGVKKSNIDMEVERHDGRVYWVTLSLIPIKKEKNDWQYILLEDDLTELSLEKKQIEQNLAAREILLIEQEKLAAVGQLAAGIAHELNTPTTYIRGNMQTFDKYTKIIENLTSRLQPDISPAEQKVALDKLTQIMCNMKEIANSSFEGTSRLMNIISSMKTFVRQSKDENRQISIYDPIKDGLVLVFNRLKHVGTATVNGRLFQPGATYDESSVPVMVTGSSMRLSQFIIILLNNAIDAWQDKVDNGEDREALKLEITVTKVGSMTKVQVCDNAGGIPEELQGEIFEPFFTSKAVNVGTGLGLSIARQIAAEHNGTLTLENRLGEGACFVLKVQESRVKSQESI